METQFIIGSLVNLVINLLYTVSALFVGVIALKIIDVKILKKLDIEEELKSNNIAVAIFSSTIMIFIALLICFGFKG